MKRPPRFPLFETLSKMSIELTEAEQKKAAPKDRLASIIPYMLQRAWGFARTLTTSQRINYDPEDTLSEIYEEMLLKDEKWNPELSSYMTFAHMMIDHLLIAIRDRSRTVHSPRNSGSRLAAYEAKRVLGELTGPTLATANAIQGTRTDPVGTQDYDSETGTAVLDSLCRAEEENVLAKAMLMGLSVLSPYEAAVVGSKWGLWGKEIRNITEIANDLGMSALEVRGVLNGSESKMKEKLAKMEHAIP